MSRYRILAFSAMTILSAMALNTGSAFAGNWDPNGAVTVGVSTDLVLTAEKAAGVFIISSCNNVTLNGTLGTNSTTWTITPGLNCTGDTTSNTWTAMDENMTQASLKIPAGVKVELQIMAGCKLVFEAQAITKATNYANGTNGAAMPSKWKINDNASYVAQNPAKCFKNVEAGTAKIEADFLMINTSNIAAAIKVL